MEKHQTLNQKALEALLMTDSPSSIEDEVYDFVNEFNNDSCLIERDTLGNIFLSIAGGSKSSVMIAAHCDEIGLQVVHITEGGLIRFRPIGGVDTKATAGRHVNIFSNGSKIPGVICKNPIHIENVDNKDKSIIFSDMWIDSGCSSSDEAKGLISVGDIISFSPNYIKLTDNRISSKALDNKLGVFVAVSAIKRLSEASFTASKVTTVLTSQEEVGSKGATVAANSLKPTWGICIDVGVATDCPGVQSDKYGELYLSKGPGLSDSTDTSITLTHQAAVILEREGIPFQKTVWLSATGGTDTMRMQIAGNGVPCLLISIPIRSMHTPTEVCDLNDVSSAIDAVVALIRGIRI